MSGKGILGLLSIVFGTLLATALMGQSGWSYFGGGPQSQANRMLQDVQAIKSKVAADAVARYRVAQASGSAMEACVQAGSVTAAYLQARDDVNYQQWKQTERADCAKAGMEN